MLRVVLLAWTTSSLAAEDAVVLEADGLTVTEGEVAARIEGIREARGLKSAPPVSMVRQVVVAMHKSKAMERDALAKHLDKDPAIETALVDARRQVLAGALLRAAKREAEVLDFEQAARDYYDSHLNDFTAPDRAMVSHILLKLECDCVSCDCLAERDEKAKKAKAILERLEKGENFTQLAIEASEDTATAGLGGSLGRWITREEVDPRFAQAAFALKPGEWSGVVETKFGFHIIRMDQFAKEERMPFEEVKDGLIDKMSQEYRQRVGGKVSETYETRAKAGNWDQAALERLAGGSATSPEESSKEEPVSGTD
jgi:peptidyl-prolyl cis-trans isomerase C